MPAWQLTDRAVQTPTARDLAAHDLTAHDPAVRTTAAHDWPKREAVAAAPAAHMGVKVVTVFPGNAAQGLPSVHAVYTLFDARTGVPLAQIEGTQLTARRTAAASALAASCLARADAAQLLVVGAGRVASLVPEAMACVRPIRRVRVWNHRAAGAQQLAQRLQAQGFDAEPVGALDAALREAEIVSCATLSTLPLLHGAQLREGTHVDLVGAFAPEMCEADAECFARARVFVDHDEALLKAGDVLHAIAAGAFAPARLQGTLQQLCRGERAGRGDAREITLYKSVGSALQDLAAAQLVFARHSVA
ncbi:MAG: ornithine cyclodeaminase family protein [Ideonella sp.]|nr:ornithine cyclodeaminase family protein [Ideonella sp.]